MASYQVASGLVENALDFLLSAAEHARSESARDCKYAILHLSAAVELLVKARLGKEHWALLFADVDKAEESKLTSGDFRSVDFQSSCERLHKIAGMKISAEDARQLKGLRTLRNRLEHFVIVPEITQARSLVAKGTSFSLGFVRATLPEEVAVRGDVIEEIHGHLREFDEFVAGHIDTIASELTKAAALFACPRCLQQTMMVGDGDPRCPFCGFSCSPTELAESLGEGSVVEPCLNCGEHTLGFVLSHNEFGADYCTTCGTKQAMCLRCRQRYLGDGDTCPHCGYSP